MIISSELANHWNDVTLESKQAKVKYHKEIFFRNYVIGLIPGSRIPDNIVLFNLFIYVYTINKHLVQTLVIFILNIG